MTEFDLILQVKVTTIVDSEFQVVKKKNGVVCFRSLRFPKHKYLLTYESLNEFQILEVAKILKEVYSKISYQTLSYDRNSSKFNDDTAPVSLNQNSESSCKLVSTIVSLPTAANHRLLLLTSGNRFISSCDPELVILLAKLKKEIDTPSKIFADDYIFELLKDLYILPGATDKMVKFPGNAALQVQPQESFEETIRLMAFLASDSDTRVLSEHLDLDLKEAIATQGSLSGYERISTIQTLLFSEYEKLMLSMTASELISLANILLQEPPNIRYSEEILKSRCKAIEKNVKRLSYLQKDSIDRYLSKEEQSHIKSPSFFDDVNSLITSRDVKAVNPPIVYAALAEVFAVRGEKSVLEIAKELSHLRLSKNRTRKMYAATVFLIAEALKPEAVDYPFSWFAQMSEHAWVLTDHITPTKVGS